MGTFLALKHCLSSEGGHGAPCNCCSRQYGVSLDMTWPLKNNVLCCVPYYNFCLLECTEGSLHPVPQEGGDHLLAPPGKEEHSPTSCMERGASRWNISPSPCRHPPSRQSQRDGQHWIGFPPKNPPPPMLKGMLTSINKAGAHCFLALEVNSLDAWHGRPG